MVKMNVCMHVHGGKELVYMRVCAVQIVAVIAVLDAL